MCVYGKKKFDNKNELITSALNNYSIIYSLYLSLI